MATLESGPEVNSAATPPSPRGDFYMAFWALAAERQRIFEARLNGDLPPWTDDPVLRMYKFCNAFRASDRTTQYLIQRVIHGAPGLGLDDTVLRTVLFRLFSWPATWELIEEESDCLRVRSFDPDWIGIALEKAIEQGARLYTSAFILSGRGVYGHRRKHRNHLALVEEMLRDRLPDRIAQANSLRDIFGVLLRFPMIGPFIAYQMAIDINYADQLGFNEDDFVVIGPGAERGLRRVFRDLGDLSPGDAVRWLVEQQGAVAESTGISAPSLFGRRLHAIDCLNLLCEVDRYARIVAAADARERARISRIFAPTPEPPRLFYPPAWGINGRIPLERRAVPPAFDPRRGHPAPVAPLGVAPLG